ncbi:MAG: D-aminoacyl-tRNA deacylase [Halolamina sp.]
MTIGIVVSRADRASLHIGEQLLAQGEWTEHEDDQPDAVGGGTFHRDGPFELREFDELHIHLDDPAPAFSDDLHLLVFVSRHSGETGALLTGHFTGNFGAAAYGGEDRTLAETAPSALSAYIGALSAHAPEGYDVAIEGTHHGPTALDTPAMFAELGSGDEQWDDPDGARAVAQAVLSLRGVDAHRERQVVGIGGGHYAPRFGRIVRETPWAVGHIASDWQLDELGHPRTDEARAVLESAFERSNATHALLDGDHPEVADVIEDRGYRVVSETWVRTVGDRPLDLVRSLESNVAAVDEGLRFGVHVPEAEDWVQVRLPDDLLTAAQNVDGVATRAAVENRTVAFDTIESGTRAQGDAAVPDRAAYHDLIDDLAAILRESYDEVHVDAETVIAREEAFDPEKARKLGIPDGPKMGKLSGGESVEVDGEVIPPNAVTSESEEVFRI